MGNVGSEGREKRKRKTQVITALSIIAVVVLGIIGLALTRDGDNNDGSIPELKPGEEWWYSSSRAGGGTQGTYVTVKVTGTKVMGGDHYYTLEENRWENSTKIGSEELLASMGNLSLCDTEGIPLSQPFSFPLHEGKEWVGVMEGIEGHVFKCSRFYDLKTPAGTFDGYKIDSKGPAGDFIFWYSPEVRYIVAMEYSPLDDAAGGDNAYRRELVGFGGRDGDSDGMTDKGEGILGCNPSNRDTDKDGVPDGTDLNPLIDLGFTLELIHLTIEERTDVISDPDVYIWIQISAGSEFLSESTDTYRNQHDIALNLAYVLDISDDGEAGPMIIGGAVNFWEQKEPAELGIALDVCGDSTEVDGFHFYFTYDLNTGQWRLYPQNPFWGSPSYLTGDGEYTVTGLDDGFSLMEERPVQDATLTFDMY